MLATPHIVYVPPISLIKLVAVPPKTYLRTQGPETRLRVTSGLDAPRDISVFRQVMQSRITRSNPASPGLVSVSANPEYIHASKLTTLTLARIRVPAPPARLWPFASLYTVSMRLLS